MPPHVIDKGIPTAGLLAQVLVAKYADHLPLYRQETIFARAGLPIPRSTLAQWVGKRGVQLQPLVDAMRDDCCGARVLHADETPVAMLDPGTGKTKRAYLWSYCSTSFDATGGGLRLRRPPGEHAAHSWRSRHPGEQAGAVTLVCDDSPATRRCSPQASPKRAAWRMRGASSTSCGPTQEHAGRAGLGAVWQALRGRARVAELTSTSACAADS